MKFVRFEAGGQPGLGVDTDAGLFGLTAADQSFPGSLDSLLSTGSDLQAAAKVLRAGQSYDRSAIRYLPPLDRPGKMLAIGLNYVDHAAEGGFEVPTYPTVFPRFTSSLIGHGDALVCPRVSDQVDYEGELVAIVGKRGRHIAEADALGHVAGYSIFNDVSIRDYQKKTRQWTMGKNFDGTGAFGPVFVTADELPDGGMGSTLTTRLNGTVMQQQPIDDMVFSVARLVCIISEVVTLEPGDAIITGTPAGVGVVRSPPIFLKPGDICEVTIDGIGTLSNTVVAE